jgi:hypothetical protein
MSVRPSVPLSTGTLFLVGKEKFNGILYLGIFRKSARKIQVSLKSDNNNRYFT